MLFDEEVYRRPVSQCEDAAPKCECRSGQPFRRTVWNVVLMAESYDELPLVYSCSGCSSAAQMANDLAVRLDRERVAEMSCIAGVGGDVGPLVD
ncbi:MAG: putative zinc-binding protein, partial [Haloplanus sp.]